MIPLGQTISDYNKQMKTLTKKLFCVPTHDFLSKYYFNSRTKLIFLASTESSMNKIQGIRHTTTKASMDKLRELGTCKCSPYLINTVHVHQTSTGFSLSQCFFS